MAGVNEFLIFDENNKNTITNEMYSVDEQRINGVGGGLQDQVFITSPLGKLL